MRSTSSVLGKNIFHLRKPGDYPVLDVTVAAKSPWLKELCCHSLCRQNIRSVVTDVLDLSTRMTEGYLNIELETSLIVFFIYKLFQNSDHIGLWRVQWAWRPPLLTRGPSSFMTKVLSLRISDLLKLFGNLGTLTLPWWAFHFWFFRQVVYCVNQTFLLDHFRRLIWQSTLYLEQGWKGGKKGGMERGRNYASTSYDYRSFVAAEFDDGERNGNVSIVTGGVHSFGPGFFHLSLCLWDLGLIWPLTEVHLLLGAE